VVLLRHVCCRIFVCSCVVCRLTSAVVVPVVITPGQYGLFALVYDCESCTCFRFVCITVYFVGFVVVCSYVYRVTALGFFSSVLACSACWICIQ
jgi:hypothetical protein